MCGALYVGMNTLWALCAPYRFPGVTEMMSAPHTSQVIRGPLSLGRADWR
jgi:hypothetical protein